MAARGQETSADRTHGVRVLREDPALARGMSRDAVGRAARVDTARVISLRKGIFWPHEQLPDEPGGLGMLLLDGLLLRGAAVTDRPTLEVLGPGDVFRPFEAPGTDGMVAAELRWWALRPARIAVLDAEFARRMCDYPQVVTELARRISRRSAASSLRLAIAAEPRLSVRLHWTLWQLADRFGEPQPDGIWLRLPLCHTLLSWLVGTRRPALSRAINELERSKMIARRPDGTWWLGGQRPRAFNDSSPRHHPLAA